MTKGRNAESVVAPCFGLQGTAMAGLGSDGGVIGEAFGPLSYFSDLPDHRQAGKVTRIPEQTVGRAAQLVDFRPGTGFAVSSAARLPFFQVRLLGGRFWV